MPKIENKYGTIELTDTAFACLVGGAATSCYGVVGMANRSKTDGIVRLLKREAMDKGVKVTANGKDIIIDLHIMVEYGVNIGAICESIINRVKYFTEKTTGYNVVKVNVHVDSIRIDSEL